MAYYTSFKAWALIGVKYSGNAVSRYNSVVESPCHRLALLACSSKCFRQAGEVVGTYQDISISPNGPRKFKESKSFQTARLRELTSRALLGETLLRSLVDRSSSDECNRQRRRKSRVNSSVAEVCRWFC